MDQDPDPGTRSPGQVEQETLDSADMTSKGPIIGGSYKVRSYSLASNINAQRPSDLVSAAGWSKLCSSQQPAAAEC